MTAIISAMSDAFTLVGTVITNITGQPVLLFFLAASLMMRWNMIFLSVILNIRSLLLMQGCIAKLMRTVTDTIRSSLLIICCKRIISAMKKYCVIGESSSRKSLVRSLTAASAGFVKTKLHNITPSLFAGGFLFTLRMCHSILFLHQSFMLGFDSFVLSIR